MKVITLWQPWASFIALGWKTIETRTHDRFRGLAGQTIGIHAGNTWDKDWKELAGLYLTEVQIQKTFDLKAQFFGPYNQPKGKIICTAKVNNTGWLGRSDSVRALIDCSFDKNYKSTRCGLFLTDIKPITPIPAKGKQGIWNFDEKLIRYV